MRQAARLPVTGRALPALLLLAVLAGSAGAGAATKVVGPGQTLNLTEDLVLTGDDVLEINGTKDSRCTLAGNGKQIRTKDRWTGRLKISFCTLKQLGAVPAVKPDKSCLEREVFALDLSGTGKSAITIENSTFEACSTIRICNLEDGQAAFCSNEILANSLAPAVAQPWLSRPAFMATGGSGPSKPFIGNLILKGGVVIEAPNWRVGGHAVHESNLIIGLRAGLSLSGSGTSAVNNYVHALMPPPDQPPQQPYWSQVSVFSATKECSADSNVFRGGQWVVRNVGGDFQRNLLLDSASHGWLLNPGGGRVHHNIFVGGAGVSGVCVSQPGEETEIFNNTFDGGGRLQGPALTVDEGCLVRSLRNNVFYNFPGALIVGPPWNEKPAQPPRRLRYADYNLFWNTKAQNVVNYGVAVAGRNERQEAGFALNDAPKGGQKNAQLNPKFKGPLPGRFPFSDEEIKSRKVTVPQILQQYRQAYSPADDSPCQEAGDPADGPGADIGAIDNRPPPPPPPPKK